ncbi:MAG TPA: ATP-dependent sacrificial sulfur transferase LarE [Acidimicrobiales bacterium]|nr:ATP-dependent sacrificial sulfur transferase LarE [Acidimicrobiales bacterium]
MSPTAVTDAAIDTLRAELRRHDRIVVAFSGGADSAFLAWMAHDTLGADRAVAVTAVSPSLADRERSDCAALADEWGLSWVEIETHEYDDDRYRANDRDRCFWCKDALMDAVAPVAAARGAVVTLGVNLDDLGDHRPGQQAAQAKGAAFPLVDAGFTKADVRAASRALGLRTWDKPAAPCLASRLPYGTAVTLRRLAEVEAAEAALHHLGFVECRVRHYGELARIEVPVADLPRLVARHDEVVAAVRAAGYRYVTVDLDGLRSGNLNG